MKKIIIIGVVIVLVGVVAWISNKGPVGQQVSTLDAIDTVGNFYEQWLKAVKEPTADPNRVTLAESPILSKALSERLTGALQQLNTTPDPVLCQTVTPESVSTRSIYESADEAQLLVTPKDKKATGQAIVTLIKYNEGWYIDNIECSLGEFAPEQEFSFEEVGYLLKGSIPSPYNPKDWHLVFEEDGVPGHVVPIFFNSKSQCTGLDGTKSVCKPEQLTEVMKVSIHGQMSELGVIVERQEVVK